MEKVRTDIVADRRVSLVFFDEFHRLGCVIDAPLRNGSIVGSEIIGLVPMEALIDTASYYLGLENFSMQQVLEARIME